MLGTQVPAPVKRPSDDDGAPTEQVLAADEDETIGEMTVAQESDLDIVPPAIVSS